MCLSATESKLLYQPEVSSTTDAHPPAPFPHAWKGGV